MPYLAAFDGTWNTDKTGSDYGACTNVVKIMGMYDGTKTYYRGIGTRYGIIGKLLGGAFGVGGKARIRRAIDDIETYLATWPGDYIDIVGFSRGAALAVECASRLAARGISVRCLMVFDCVAAFGIPINILGIPFQRINLGYRIVVPRTVEMALHAMALDEQRAAFQVTRLHGAREVWFKGGHSDVGGGNGNVALSNISLQWMVETAADAGVPLFNQALPVDPSAPPLLVPPGPAAMRRNVRPTDLIHATAADRFPCHNPNLVVGTPA